MSTATDPIPRSAKSLVLDALADTRVVFIAGARQAGKSTLARQIAGRTGHELTELSLDRRQTREAALADPEVRRAILAWTPSSPAEADAMDKAYDRTFVLGNPPDYEPGPERSLAGLAAARGVSPLEVAYDEMARDGGQGLLYIPILNYATGDLDHVREMMLHPQGLLGLADGGAHTGTICDASMPTFMLTHWTRDRSRGERLPLEYVVKKQTHDTARLYGLSDRGTVEPGALADFNLIDYEGLSLGVPYVEADLPAGGRRLLQKASGYVATIKAGTVTFEQGAATGELPGRLVRGAR